MDDVNINKWMEERHRMKVQVSEDDSKRLEVKTDVDLKEGGKLQASY